jgi:hypothetical protein
MLINKITLNGTLLHLRYLNCLHTSSALTSGLTVGRHLQHRQQHLQGYKKKEEQQYSNLIYREAFRSVYKYQQVLITMKKQKKNLDI